MHFVIFVSLTLFSEKTLSRCEQERLDALKNGQVIDGELIPPLGAFVPTCEADGSYTEVQCLPSTGECWCVNEDGGIRDETRTKGHKPVCQSKNVFTYIYS